MVLRKTSEPQKRNNNNFAHNESSQIKFCGKSAPSSHIENLYASSWKKEDHFLLGKVDSRPGKSAVFLKKEKNLSHFLVIGRTHLLKNLYLTR